jgi:hypothetical protein
VAAKTSTARIAQRLDGTRHLRRAHGRLVGTRHLERAGPGLIDGPGWTVCNDVAALEASVKALGE